MRGRARRPPDRRSDAREGERAPEPAPADLVMALQRTAGNQAVGRVLQRKVAVGGKAWLKKNAKLPDVPATVSAAYQAYVVDRAVTLAKAWRDDDVDAETRRFGTPDALYTAACNAVVTEGGPGKRVGARWGALKAAVDASGNVTDLPWASFSVEEAQKLLTELQECDVQVSSNTQTTACHANGHQKLPKKVSGPGGKSVAELPPHEQPLHTPYVEFLVENQKAKTGIERGILDRASGLVYLTAHYDKGSIVWLSGAPQALVSNWTAKAQDYCDTLMGVEKE